MEHSGLPSPEGYKPFETIFNDTIGFASDHPVFSLEDLHEFLASENYDLPDLSEFSESFQAFREQLTAVCKYRGLNPAWYKEPGVGDGGSLHAFIADEAPEREALTGSLEELLIYVEDVLKDLFQTTPIIARRDVAFYLRYVKGLGNYADAVLATLVEEHSLVLVSDFYMLPDVALAAPTEIDEAWGLDEDPEEPEGPESDDDALIVPALLPEPPSRRALRVVDIFADQSDVPVVPQGDFLEKEFREAPPLPDKPFTYDERKWAEVILNRISWIAAREDGVRMSVLMRYVIEQMAAAHLQERQVSERVNELVGRLWTRQMIARDLSDSEDPRWGLPDANRGQDERSRSAWPKTLNRLLELLQDPYAPPKK
jgi:hypothetical protein